MGVTGDRRGLELKLLLKAGDPGQAADASQEEAVGGKIVRQQRHGLPVESGNHFGRPPDPAVPGIGYDRSYGKTCPVRIGVRQRPGDPSAPENQHKAVRSPVADDDLRLADPSDGAQFFAEGSVQPAVYAAGSAVGDDSRGTDGTEVGARGHVLGPQVQVKSQSLDHASIDSEYRGIVAEQPQVTGTASRRDSRQERGHPAHGRILRQFVQVGGGGGLQRGPVASLSGCNIADAVQDQQDELPLGPVRQPQRSIQDFFLHRFHRVRYPSGPASSILHYIRFPSAGACV